MVSGLRGGDGGFDVRPRLLAALVAVDLAVIAAHVVLGLTYESIPPLMNIAMDRSIGEIWGYGKWLAAVVLLVVAWRRGGNGFFLAAAGIFAIVLLDDALQFHETLGARIGLAAGLPESTGGLAPHDVGELAVFGAIGLAALALLAWAWRSSRPGDARAARWLVALLVLLALFGVVLDAVHAATGLGWPVPQILDLLEDGGELLIGSLAVAHAAALLAQARPS